MSNKMTIDQAIRILDPATSKAEVEKIRASIITDNDEDRYYATIAKVDEACVVACEIMRKWKEHEKWAKFQEELTKPVTNFPESLLEEVEKLEKKNTRLAQYNNAGKQIKTHLTPEGVNPYPCTCGSNCFHYEVEYDAEQKSYGKMYGVCNGCQEDIYEVPFDKIDEILKIGVWKPHPTWQEIGENISKEAIAEITKESKLR